MRSTIERALELAADGKHRTIEDIRVTLKRERFDNVDAHTSGSSIQQQLKIRMVAAHKRER